ncbi:unnamed protein product (macronuclear) [Paramecium tetraurelia]|uniref:Uncharacterized protein n=1 Tax=Paramecium tetraurelia TaxID=5888 RepID=A0DD70_PARTE|nr:uncharacterized protein GSPATT00015846001 [Paramecium tetraurelia]CAK80987.1 unnamed protein product [Paramecium tetraurelia]|eukprot:XP_001448384.1 hypothetical protein (macronuclear) [Paramecium tetraurelia strain d4-2]
MFFVVPTHGAVLYPYQNLKLRFAVLVCQSKNNYAAIIPVVDQQINEIQRIQKFQSVGYFSETYQ